MFRLPEDTEMTIDLLGKLLKEHKQEVKGRHQKLQNTYESDHEILHKPKKPKHKPDNRIVVNFPKYLVDTFNGFFIGIPVKTTHEDKKVTAYVEELDAYNDQDDNNSELSKIMDIHGRGFELYFTDGEAKLRITYLSPLEAFIVFDDTVLEEPLFFVRFYTDYFGKEKGRVYSRKEYRDFQVKPEMKYTDPEWTPHNFPGVPATEFIENAERQGLFEPVQTMVDAFNKGISDAANNVDYFS